MAGVIGGVLVGLVTLAALLAFPVYVFIRLHRLGYSIRELTRRLESLEYHRREETAGLEAAAPPTPAPPIPPAQVKAEIPAAAPPQPPSPPPPPPLPPSAPAAPALPRRDLEAVLGANWLSKLGMVAIIVATAFFLKYAFDQRWIGPTARVAMGLVAAGVMLALSQYLLVKPRYRNYAQVLASGGIVIFFLSIWAAFSLYHLIGFSVAFGVLAMAALAASALAVVNNTQTVALICLMGAFATPVLIRSEGPSSGDLLRLYAYLAGLNLWSIILVRFRPWHSLVALSFGATWLLFFGAGKLHTPDYLAVEAFAVLFLILACVGGARSVRAQEGESPATIGLGVAFILVGCVAFVIASVLILAGVEAFGLPALAIVGVFVTLLLIGSTALFSAVSERDLIVRQVFRYLAAAALAIILGMTLAEAQPVSRGEASAAFLFCLFSYLLFLVVAIYLRGQREAEVPAIILASANAITHMTAAFQVLASVEIRGIHAATLWLPLAGCITLGALWLSARQKTGRCGFPIALVIIAQVFPLIALFGAVFEAAWHWPTIPALILFFGEFLLVSITWIGLRGLASMPKFRGDLLAAFGNAAIFFGLLAAVAGMESYQGFVLLCGCAIVMALYHSLVGGVMLGRPSDDVLHRFIYLGLALTFLTIAIPLQLKASYLTLAWAAESAILIWTGLTVRDARVRWYGAALLGITAFKVLFHDMLVSPEHFRFLLNTRTLSGASVIAASYLSVWLLGRRREALSALEARLPAAFAVVANLFTLIFVSLDLWNQFGGGGTTAREQNAQQLSLSIFWSIYALALMSVGIWKRLRPVRLFAMGLLYFSIFKVFIFDLRFLEQPYRIVSFLGLGVILLLVSLLYTRFEGRLK